MPFLTAAGLLAVCLTAGEVVSAVDRGTKVLMGRKVVKKLVKRLKKMGMKDALVMQVILVGTTDEEKDFLTRFHSGGRVTQEEWCTLLPATVAKGRDACDVSPLDESGQPDPTGRSAARKAWR